MAGCLVFGFGKEGTTRLREKIEKGNLVLSTELKLQIGYRKKFRRTGRVNVTPHRRSTRGS